MTVLHLQVVAGFGNRLRSMMSGICFAEDLKIKLCIYWNGRDSHCAIPFHSVFDMETLPSFVTVVNGILSQSDTCNSVEDKERLLAAWDGKSDLYFNSYGNFHIPDREIWLKHLRALKPIAQLQQMIDQKIPPFDTERLVGVHIRRTDNWKAIQTSPFPLFVEKMDSLDAFFIVATDDWEIRRYLENRYKGRILFPSKLLERSTQEGMLNAMVDFFCLARCPTIIGSEYSSFNDIAAFYGGSKLIKLSVPT